MNFSALLHLGSRVALFHGQPLVDRLSWSTSTCRGQLLVSKLSWVASRGYILWQRMGERHSFAVALLRCSNFSSICWASAGEYGHGEKQDKAQSGEAAWVLGN